MSPFTIKDFNPAWIRNGIDAKAIEFAEGFGEHLAKEGLTNTQLRNIFSEVKLIESLGYAQAKTRFLLLAPKIAYTVKRNSHRGKDADKSRPENSESALSMFKDVFNRAYEAVHGTEEEEILRFERFVDFMEAFLAYHRYHSPDKKS
jgi:CRISPR type III-A-associated protein Csm2